MTSTSILGLQCRVAAAFVFGAFVTRMAFAQIDWSDRSSTDHPPTTCVPAAAYDSARGRVVLFVAGETWEWDGARWSFRTSTGPGFRIQTAMTYDSARGRTVLFGGNANGNRLADTWEWDGSSWTSVATPTSPLAREDHALAFDSARGRVVLFGGTGAFPTSYGSDTWEYDGVNWTQQAPAVSPSARCCAGMAFDSARAVTVLFGGNGDSLGARLETWEWDGTNWSQRSGATSPPGRSLHALAFDAARGETILYGGLDSNSIRNDTWAWNGSTWRAITTSQTAGPRYRFALAFDANHRSIVLVGGGNVADTWTWNGATWTQAAVSGNPPGGFERALAFDSQRGRAVHARADGLSIAVWERDDSGWRRSSPAASPPFRSVDALAFDSIRGRTILFGGFVQQLSFARADTWEWDGSAWFERMPSSSPNGRLAHALAFDSARGVTVLFGGSSACDPMFGCTLYGDTWEWDGTSWSRRIPATSPSPRLNVALAFDSARGRTVLFGGRTSVGASSETWEWDGSSWTPLFPVTSPSPRFAASMAFDAARGRVVLYGGTPNGVTYGTDSWEWDGTNWTPITSAHSPTILLNSGAAYDASKHRVLVFGSNACAMATWTLDGPLTLASVIPSSGSAAGGDLVTIRGFGFTSAPTTTVQFGGTTAAIVDADSDRIRVRTPPGAGVADVSVSSTTGTSTLFASYLYLAPEIAARLGNVHTGRGDREDVLTINGSRGDSNREMTLAIGAPLTITMSSPSSLATASFALYAWRRIPDVTTLAPQPMLLGTMVLSTPLDRTGGSRPAGIWNNIGHTSRLGVPSLPSTAAPSTVLRLDQGAPRALDATFQGFVIDVASATSLGASVTNAIVLRVR